MREVKIGDIVLSLTDNLSFTSTSVVSSGLEELQLGWERWYRVRLSNYRKLTPPLGREVFFSDPFARRMLEALQSSKNLFFEGRLRLRQGAYLTPLPVEVAIILNDAYLAVSNSKLIDLSGVGDEFGSANGSRTRLSALKGPRPNR